MEFLSSFSFHTSFHASISSSIASHQCHPLLLIRRSLECPPICLCVRKRVPLSRNPALLLVCEFTLRTRVLFFRLHLFSSAPGNQRRVSDERQHTTNSHPLTHCEPNKLVSHSLPVTMWSVSVTLSQSYEQTHFRSQVA